MRFGKRIALVIVLLALAGTAYWIYHQEYGDAAKIRQTVNRLAEALSKPESENAAVSLLKIKTIADSFAAPLALSLPEYVSGNFSEEEITAHASRYRTMMKRARVYAHGIEFEHIGKNSAKIWFSGHVDGETKNGFKVQDVKEIEMQLVKIENRWLIQSASVRQVLH